MEIMNGSAARRAVVSVGMIGGGFAARLHGDAARLVGSVDVRLRGVADVNPESARRIAQEYGYEYWTDNHREVLEDPEVDVVILCTPPRLHTDMIIEALDAGKHVICEKPLTGYFGQEGDGELIGDSVSKQDMYRKVAQDMAHLEQAVQRSDKQFMYAENYIYTPTIQRAAEFIRAKKSTVTYMRGEESVQGSPTAGAGYWKNIGGGTLLRIGCHPLGGILYLKQVEAEAKGTSITVEQVVADTGRINVNLSEEEKKYLLARPKDVEDFGTVTMTFSDGTKATVFANDNVLGGIRNYVEVYCNDATIFCKITPTDTLQTYFPDQDGLDGVYMSEKLEDKTGWNQPFVSESIQRGYVAQLQDFLECAATGRRPLSHFGLARQISEILYAAYISAEEGRRVSMASLS